MVLWLAEDRALTPLSRSPPPHQSPTKIPPVWTWNGTEGAARSKQKSVKCTGHCLRRIQNNRTVEHGGNI